MNNMKDLSNVILEKLIGDKNYNENPDQWYDGTSKNHFMGIDPQTGENAFNKFYDVNFIELKKGDRVVFIDSPYRNEHRLCFATVEELIKRSDPEKGEDMVKLVDIDPVHSKTTVKEGSKKATRRLAKIN